MKPGVKKALNVASYVVVILIFLLAISMVIMTFSTPEPKSPKTMRIPKMFDRYFLDIQTESMDTPDGFKAGSLVFAEVFTNQELKVGDWIAFEYDVANGYKPQGAKLVDPDNKLLVHEIIEIRKIDKKTLYITHGLNNPEGVNESCSTADIYGIYKSHIGGLGAILRFFKSPVGFGLVVVLPVFIFFVYRVIKLILVIRGIRVEKIDEERDMSKEQLEKLQKELEALKARIIDAPKETVNETDNKE